MNELLKNIKNLLIEVVGLKENLQLKQKKTEIAALEAEMQQPDFWNDQENARKKSEKYNFLKEQYDFWAKLEADLLELLGVTEQSLFEGKDLPEERTYLETQFDDLNEKYHRARIEAFFAGKHDDHSAILSIHAGAGGTDAQDWAEILLRMYLRFCERRNFKVEILEKSKGSEAGIKNVLLEVSGRNAYGFLKGEQGVHRLVRLSPFNPAHTRETSFALVEALPVLEKEVEFKVDPNDLKIEASTSSGAGGQSVNTTYSAIRITHIPTGIKVSIQNERSQHQNKEKALEILRSKLLKLEEERLHKEKEQLRGEYKSPEWGNQIRSYVLHPYKMVKDHRTGMESSEPDRVLDGDIEQFIEKYLESTLSMV